ncbi:Lipopolysaccharide core biosynthesis protein RfaG [Rosistilla carotiformis]|uniref:Lipopolysaccharide core biosynthesis protein RfaG n=1 Tax=Rosistilla carotiformis TaxID=2528017 RepID=A0A518JLC9_9BACT|nr:glycosyltransferase family 4 protein [Rosistilla carotiformis]QDV66348.1 Lipopolysaccharide core biosynthesis protein RfaG [Rosistilla carotiformis]
MIINANRHEGTSRAVLEVAQRLVLRGHHVDLIARTVEAIEGTGIHWIRIPGPTRPEFLDFATFKRRVDRRLRNNHGYDIVHSAGPNTSLADVYTIQTVHPIKVQQTAESRSEATAGWLRRLSWGAYDRYVIRCEKQAYLACGPTGPRAFLPVSEGTKQELLETYPQVRPRYSSTSPARNVSQNGTESEHDDESAGGSESGSVRVIPNGADLDRFTPANRELHRDDVRHEHGIADDDFLLAFSGGDWRRKGLDLALQALAKLSDPKIKLLVVGHDRSGGDVRQLSDKLGLQSRVTFAGFRSDVHRYYAAGDLFLFPTSYEAFSLATIEAAASGLPVLMPDVSGAQELIGCGTTGAMILRDPQHIAATIMRFVESNELLARSGVAARTLVEQRFNWDVITQQTLDVYQHLIARRSSGAASSTMGQPSIETVT